MNIFIGTLEDFNTTNSRQHEQNRHAMIQHILDMKDPFIAIETLSILANVLINQKCPIDIIKPLYYEINRLFTQHHKHLTAEKYARAYVRDLHAIHNHIIIFIEQNNCTSSHMKHFSRFFEFLSTCTLYHSQEKARHDLIKCYMILAHQLECEKKDSEAYIYYKKAFDQTTLPAIGFRATKKLLKYDSTSSTFTKRPFDAMDAFGCLFEDADLPELKCAKY